MSVDNSKKYTYIVSVNLVSNEYINLIGENRLFNDPKLDTFDKLVDACANHYILESDKESFIKRLDRFNLYETIRVSEYLNYSFRVFKNESVWYFSMKVIKQNDFEVSKKVIITFEKSSKEEYLQINDQTLYEAIASARLNNYPVILVLNYDDLKIKVFTNGDPEAGYVDWNSVKNYDNLLSLVLNCVENKSRALESLNLNDIKPILYNNNNHYETIVPIGKKKKVFIKFDFTQVMVRGEKYIVIALSDESYEINKSLNDPRMNKQEVSIYKALTLEFTSLFIVGYHTGKTSYYSLDNKSNFSQIMQCNKLSDAINLYIRNYVHDDDKERIFRIFIGNATRK